MVKQRAMLALVFNALVWGVSWWPFRALAERGLHSLWATALVYAASFAVVLAMRPTAGALAARTPLVWAIGAASGATNACFNWAVATGDVVRVVLLFYLMPVWSMLLARWLLGEPLRLRAWARAALALTGAALVVGGDAGHAQPVRSAAGATGLSLPDALAIAGGMAFALTNVLLRKAAHEPEAARALGMFAGGVVVPGALAVALAAAGTIGWLPAPHQGWIAGTLALAAAFLVSNLALQYGAARLPAGVTSLVMLTEVVFAAGSSLLLGAAQGSVAIAVGGALIVATVLWAALDRAGGPHAAA